MERSRETYRAAGREHLAHAQILLRGLATAMPSSLVLFLAGPSVECYLRSLDPRASEHDPRHSLEHWFGKTAFVDRAPAQRRQEVALALAFLAQYWRSEHRYASSDVIAQELRRLGLRSRKGERIEDPVQTAARRALGAAILIADIIERQNS